MHAIARWLALVLVLAVGTALVGWWAVPVVAALWGVSGWAREGAWWKASAAAALAWALLLAWTATQGPVLALAEKVGPIFSLPAIGFLFLPLFFAAVLAGSAAELASSLRGLADRRAGAAPQD